MSSYPRSASTPLPKRKAFGCKNRVTRGQREGNRQASPPAGAVARRTAGQANSPDGEIASGLFIYVRLVPRFAALALSDQRNSPTLQSARGLILEPPRGLFVRVFTTT